MSYKKVITTEETFEYDYPPVAVNPPNLMTGRTPMLLPMPMMGVPMPPVFCGNTGNLSLDSNPAPMISSFYAGNDPQNSPNAVELRMSAREVMSKYVSTLREYLKSRQASTADADAVKENLNKIVSTDFDKLALDYYATDHVAMTNSLAALTNGLTNAIDVGALSGDTSATLLDVNKLADAFGMQLQKINPEWDAQIIASMWSKVGADLISQVAARIKKDWAVDEEFAQDIYNNLVAGVPMGLASFADIFSYGTVMNQGWRFRKPIANFTPQPQAK